MDDILKDERFSHIVSDPRFKRIPIRERKVKIDKRFQSMFKDKQFSMKYTVDKRGRPVKNSTTEDLRRYYDISSDSQSDDDKDDGVEGGKEKGTTITSKNRRNVVSKENKNTSKVLKIKIKDANKKRVNHELVNHSENGDHYNGIGKISAKNNQVFKVKKKKQLKGEYETNTENDEHVPQSDSYYSEDHEETDDDLHNILQLETEERIPFTDRAKAKLQDMTVDYARGEGVLTSSSSDDDSDEESDDELDHGWGELDQCAEHTDETTHRLALCNMDWDRIRASDLMVLFNSFVPQNGLIKSITIYPSEFGLERMKEEEMNGPPELRGNADSKDNDAGDDLREENENEEGNDYHMENLRQYQLNRLKYFYAVIDCDSDITANKLYTECDGLEYESSASRLDLRFVPDDMTFDHEPREVCDSMPDLTKYQPRIFTTTALQQSKVQLTWDETNPDRTEIAQKVLSGDIDQAELRTYLATSSSEEEEEEGKGHPKGESNHQDDNSNDGTEKTDPIFKYRSLLQGIELEEERKKNRDVEMEVSWGIGLKDKAEKLAKKKIKEQVELTPFQQYLEKRKEKKKEKKLKRKTKVAEGSEENPYSDDDIPSDIDMSDPYFREEFEDLPKKTKKQKRKKKPEENEETGNDKAELELLLMNEPENKHHFNFKAIQEQETESKKKNKRKKKLLKAAAAGIMDTDEFEVNVKDDRFAALFSSHLFNIDPADPHYHATKGMELLRAEKLKRRQEEDDHMHERAVKQAKNSSGTSREDAEVTSLVSKVRMQTKLANKNL